MKRILLTFAILLAPYFAVAQSTYTATGYGRCTSYLNALPPNAKNLSCSVSLTDANDVFFNWLSFGIQLNPAQNGVQSINTSGGNVVGLFNTSTGAHTVSGAVDTNNKTIAFTFTDGDGFSGTLNVGYYINPRHCPTPRTCSAAAVVITTGTVTIQ